MNSAAPFSAPAAPLTGGLLASALLAFLLAAAPLPAAPNTTAPQLSLTIRCTNSVIKAGDLIPIEFTIKNEGAASYHYANRNYDRSGRMPEYALTAFDSTGKPVPDSMRPGGFGGGGFQYADLAPGQTFSKTITLNNWALVLKPGRYTVHATYTAEQYANNSLPVTAKPIEINVLPRAPAELYFYLRDLTNQAAALFKTPPPTNGPPPPALQRAMTRIVVDLRTWSGRAPHQWPLEEVVPRLVYTGDPRIVPTLLEIMYGPPGNGDFWAAQGLLYFVPHTADTKRQVMDAALQRGVSLNGNTFWVLDNYGFSAKEMKPLITRLLAPDHPADWSTGAGLAQKFNDDDFAPRLIAIATDPNSNGRGEAVTALVFNRTDEGIKTLQSLLNDPDPKIHVPFAVALENGLSPTAHTNYPGRPLRPDDFTTANVKPLIEGLLSLPDSSPDVIWGVSLLDMFDDGTHTARLLELAQDPNAVARVQAIYRLARNRTDEGVQLLHILLHNSDPEIRHHTEQAIRYAYTDRGDAKGTLLRPDDFDAQYQRPKPPEAHTASVQSP